MSNYNYYKTEIDLVLEKTLDFKDLKIKLVGYNSIDSGGGTNWLSIFNVDGIDALQSLVDELKFNYEYNLRSK